MYKSNFYHARRSENQHINVSKSLLQTASYSEILATKVNDKTIIVFNWDRIFSLQAP